MTRDNKMAFDYLDAARTLQALAQTGLAYCKDAFDRERFTAIRSIALHMLAHLAKASPQKVAEVFLPETGYSTPKIDVRAVILRNDEMLFVQERSDGHWTLPGGWTDVGLSPAENVEKEVLEECGLEVRVTKLLACYDKRKHDHPLEVLHVYKLFFLCELTGGQMAPGLETSDVAFFPEKHLPSLSVHRVTRGQVLRMFEHGRDRALPTDFN